MKIRESFEHANYVLLCFICFLTILYIEEKLEAIVREEICAANKFHSFRGSEGFAKLFICKLQ
jgi:hypothetical protein